ncbi:response regulator [Reichenbachiella agarivorans]|uniref:Response regulator n=1 Tax=Reichenbachiella agarivorans TaxID=2979464 RepID=A0ABY6CPI4_9BACT|nr:response regulator [Reichenbachiella agarivorans]UXP32420.1 response regulator [Reichenbachiella agarivorans]
MYLLKNRPTKKKSVLLVDDNKIMCRLTTKILEQNFTVHSFHSAIDAINWLSEGKNIPNVIVSDIAMSDMSGLEFGQFLKLNGLYEHIPLVYMSGIPEHEVTNYPVSVNYSAYAQKPFCPDGLVRMLEDVTNLTTTETQA